MARGDVALIWRIYVAYHPNPEPALTPERRRLIEKWLRVYSVDTLIAAIHGNHADPFCNGENRQHRQYHQIGLILRDADHIERYAAIRPHVSQPEQIARARRQERAAEPELEPVTPERLAELRRSTQG